MDDSNTPATKADLQQVKEQLRSEIQENTAQLRSELRETAEQVRSEMRETADQLRSEFQHGFDDLKEAFRDAQTEILKAFYSFAQTNQQRLSQVDVTTTALLARLGTVEARLLEVEKRLNMPPAA
jgi:hypothetical protein